MQRRNHAFTLIELLVVIAIIAILAAILFPVFAQAKRAAKKTVDLSNLKEIALATELFKEDHEGYYPKGWFNDEVGGEQTSTPNPFWGWDYQLQPYLKNKDIMQSPLDSESFKRGLWNGPNDHLYQNPGNVDLGPMGARSTEDDIPASYRLNISDGPNGPYSSVNESSLPFVADSILIAPSRPGLNKDNWHHLATWEGAGDPGFSCVNFVPNIQYDRNNGVTGVNNTTTMAQRTQGQANYAFADGHAKSMNWRATWKRVDADTTNAGSTVTPTMWRQVFSGWDDQCKYREGENPR